MEETKDLGGRPTDYRTKFNKQVEKLCLLGAKDKEIADFFEITEATLNNWKQKHPKFFESIRKGREMADATVAQSLYKKAIGYTVKTGEIEREKADGTKEIVPLTKTVEPDQRSIEFWMRNRRPDLWRDQKNVDVKGIGPLTFVYNESVGNEPIQDLDPELPEPQRRDPEPGEEEV